MRCIPRRLIRWDWQTDLTLSSMGRHKMRSQRSEEHRVQSPDDPYAAAGGKGLAATKSSCEYTKHGAIKRKPVNLRSLMELQLPGGLSVPIEEVESGRVHRKAV